MALTGGQGAEAVRMFRVALAAGPIDRACGARGSRRRAAADGREGRGQERSARRARDRADLLARAGHPAEARGRRAMRTKQKRSDEELERGTETANPRARSGEIRSRGSAWRRRCLLGHRHAGTADVAPRAGATAQQIPPVIDQRSPACSGRSRAFATTPRPGNRKAASALGYWDEPWAIDAPAAEQNLTRRLRSVTAIEVTEPLVLTLDDERSGSIRGSTWSEPSNLLLSDKESPSLREFLLRGGTLTMDDFHGPYEWDLTVRQMKLLFPGSRDRRDRTAASDLHLLLQARKISADSRTRFVLPGPHVGEGRLPAAPPRHPRRYRPADGAHQLEHRHG